MVELPGVGSRPFLLVQRRVQQARQTIFAQRVVTKQGGAAFVSNEPVFVSGGHSGSRANVFGFNCSVPPEGSAIPPQSRQASPPCAPLPRATACGTGCAFDG